MAINMTLYSLPPFVIIPVVWLVFGVLLRNTIFHLPVSGSASRRLKRCPSRRRQ
jgi:ABC-type dipeptide/oligopeptide/nickel transport system permease component